MKNLSFVTTCIILTLLSLFLVRTSNFMGLWDVRIIVGTDRSVQYVAGEFSVK